MLAVHGDSCQDGAGDPTTTAFTGLGRFTIEARHRQVRGSARGRGVATFLEGADDHERMTLIGRWFFGRAEMWGRSVGGAVAVGFGLGAVTAWAGCGEGEVGGRALAGVIGSGGA